MSMSQNLFVKFNMQMMLDFFLSWELITCWFTLHESLCIHFFTRGTFSVSYITCPAEEHGVERIYVCMQVVSKLCCLNKKISSYITCPVEKFDVACKRLQRVK